jgi:lipid-binding SYLF domain-containing protein
LKKIMLFVALVSLTSLGWAQSHREKSTDRLDNAAKVLHEIMGAPDKGIPEEVLEHAKCIAVVPHLLKGGFVFGAENGRGVQRAARLLDGALRHSLRSQAEAGDCRSV